MDENLQQCRQFSSLCILMKISITSMPINSRQKPHSGDNIDVRQIRFADDQKEYLFSSGDDSQFQMPLNEPEKTRCNSRNDIEFPLSLLESVVRPEGRILISSNLTKMQVHRNTSYLSSRVFDIGQYNIHAANNSCVSSQGRLKLQKNSMFL